MTPSPIIVGEWNPLAWTCPGASPDIPEFPGSDVLEDGDECTTFIGGEEGLLIPGFQSAESAYISETWEEANNREASDGIFVPLAAIPDELRDILHDVCQMLIDISRLRTNLYGEEGGGESAQAQQLIELSDQLFRQEGKRDIRLYPNPAKNQLTIHAGRSNFEVQVCDVFGNKVFQKTFSEKLEIDISGWERGVYLFKITNQLSGDVRAVKGMV